MYDVYEVYMKVFVFTTVVKDIKENLPPNYQKFFDNYLYSSPKFGVVVLVVVVVVITSFFTAGAVVVVVVVIVLVDVVVNFTTKCFILFGKGILGISSTRSGSSSDLRPKPTNKVKDNML